MAKISKQTSERRRTAGSLDAVVGPLEACIRMERLLRDTDAYRIAMDYPTCKLGLGKWLKRVIRNAKRPNAESSDRR